MRFYILQRHMYRLNKGSSFEISCTLKDSVSGADSLIVAVVKGMIPLPLSICQW